MSKLVIGTSLALLALTATTAHSLDPDVKCQSQKLNEAAKYVSCRLKADSKAIAAVIQLILRYSPEEDSKAGAAQPLNEDEQELLLALKAQLVEETLEQQRSGDPSDEKVDEE